MRGGCTNIQGGGVHLSEGVYVYHGPKYKGRKSEFLTPSLWKEDTVKNYNMFWAIISNFSPLLTNLVNRLHFTPPNSVFSERAFFSLKLQYFRLLTSLSLAKLSFFYFFYINRRVLDRAVMSYKRNIYDLTPQEEMKEENDILDIKAEDKSGSTENESKGTIKSNEKAIEGFTNNKKPIKRRRGGSDEAFM
jgi:hypothetical protein